MNSKTDELCVLEHLYKPEEDITSMEAKKLSNDGILQGAESLIVALTEACSDETWEIDMQLPCMNSTVDELCDHHCLNAIKRKKRVRRRSQKKILSHNSEGVGSTYFHGNGKEPAGAEEENAVELGPSASAVDIMNPIARMESFRGGDGICNNIAKQWEISSSGSISVRCSLYSW